MKQGYEIGAVNYIVKPFDSEVLILKIKAILSRSKHEEAEPKPKFITIGEYVFNTELRTITKNEEQIKLTPKEARLLELLYNYKDGLLPREKALTEIWGTNDYFTARSMDVYVTKLRKYFKDDQNIKIENVHGSGFRLVIEEVKKAEGKPQLFLLLGYGYFSCLTIGRIFRGVHALESCDPVLIGCGMIYTYRDIPIRRYLWPEN